MVRAEYYWDQLIVRNALLRLMVGRYTHFI